MKKRRLAAVLAVLLCAAVLLSGALAIWHLDHQCRQKNCPVCALLAHNEEFPSCLPLVFAGIALIAGLNRRGAGAAARVCFAADANPVRRKVKLQD